MRVDQRASRATGQVEREEKTSEYYDLEEETTVSISGRQRLTSPDRTTASACPVPRRN